MKKNKNHFEWLHEMIFHGTNQAFQWTEEVRPEVYKNHQISTHNSTVFVDSKGFIGQKRPGAYRYSRFQSPLIDISTVMIYPVSNIVDYPVFAVEFVLIMDKIHVIVLDVESLDSINKYEKVFTRIRQDFLTQFPQKETVPDWYQSICTSYNVFSSGSIESSKALKELTQSYLNAYQLIVLGNKEIKNVNELVDHSLVAEYKRHHAKNSPAKTIIKGENEPWLNEFLNAYHFGIID